MSGNEKVTSGASPEQRGDAEQIRKEAFLGGFAVCLSAAIDQHESGTHGHARAVRVVGERVHDSTETTTDG